VSLKRVVPNSGAREASPSFRNVPGSPTQSPGLPRRFKIELLPSMKAVCYAVMITPISFGNIETRLLIRRRCAGAYPRVNESPSVRRPREILDVFRRDPAFGSAISARHPQRASEVSPSTLEIGQMGTIRRPGGIEFDGGPRRDS
jgi:hypothetical protein